MSETVMLVKTEAAANSNKFYELTLNGAEVVARYGRVGAKGAVHVVGQGGWEMLQKQQARKEAKGYQRVQNHTGGTAARATPAELLDRAVTEMGRGERAEALIRHLTVVNAHTIEAVSGGGMGVSDTGAVTTELGPVTAATIAEARDLLTGMQQHPSPGALNDYLMLVPQRVPRKRGWHETFFTEHTTFAAQSKFLDDLESSVRFSTAVTSAPEGASFRYVLEPARKVTALSKEFAATANREHPSYGSKLVRTYRLVDQLRGEAVTEAAARVGNVRPMWHGSRASNILSILAAGLVVPPATARHTAGRAFGDGVYFSEQSTKALNYGRGGVWSPGIDVRHFAFRANVAMGREYQPHLLGRLASWWPVTSGTTTTPDGDPYESINVAPGHAGVLNHEAVVWNTDQAELAYLCEFTG